MSPPEVAAKAAAEVVDKYGRLSNASYMRSCWASFSDDGEVHKFNPPTVCHSLMPYGPEGCDQVVTNYNMKDEELDTKFFHFMRDHLYRAYRDHLHLLPVKGKHVLHLTGLADVPANVVYNICITSRIILEFRNNLTIWSNLCDKGIDPTVAFMCMGTNAKGQTDVKVADIFDNIVNTNHWPIDHSSVPDTLMSGTPLHPSKPFKERPLSCIPCNVIWGRSPRGMIALRGKTIQEFNDFITNKPKDFKHEDLLQSS